MTGIIETVFENGVFRPLKPILLPENQRVNIRLEEAIAPFEASTVAPPHMPSVYPDPEDDALIPEADLEYQNGPPEATGTIHAIFRYEGEMKPMVYPEE